MAHSAKLPFSDPTRLAAFDLLSTLVAVLRADGTVVMVNAALEDALGVSRRNLVDTDFAQQFAEPALLLQALAGARDKAFATLRYQANLVRAPREPLPVQVILSCNDPGGDLVLELVPLAQQTRHEREHRLTQQSQANKELLKQLAHEIKNPLGGLRGAAQLLELELPAPQLREYTQIIVREADRLHGLVDRLLEPHRHASVVGDVNIHEVCERVRTLIRAEFGDGLVVQRDYDVSLPEFRGDREQLIQAVLNLARNAAQALSVRRQQGDAHLILRTRALRQATIGQQRYKLALELRVIDNGPGVPDALKERIFSPLVSGRVGGLGLGLSLAQTIAQRHHGLIECDSSPGRTEFSLSLPLP